MSKNIGVNELGSAILDAIYRSDDLALCEDCVVAAVADADLRAGVAEVRTALRTLRRGGYVRCVTKQWRLTDAARELIDLECAYFNELQGSEDQAPLGEPSRSAADRVVIARVNSAGSDMDN